MLSRLRRCLFLFDSYWLYERHLLELNGFENEYKSWKASIPLQATSLYVTTTYFNRPNTFELCTPEGICYINCDSESSLRGWLTSLYLAGVTLKSDEKPVLLWRGIDSHGHAFDHFYYCRASSSMPDHERPVTRGWNTGYGIAKLVAKLHAKAQKGNIAGGSVPMPSPLSSLQSPVNSLLPTANLLGNLQDLEPTADLSFGKHGPLAILGRSLFARLHSDELASTDPSSPFYDAQAANNGTNGSQTGADRQSSWRTRFFRTLENAAGKPVLLRYASRDITKHPTKSSKSILLTRARVYDLAQLHAQSVAYVQMKLEAEERERWNAIKENMVELDADNPDSNAPPPSFDRRTKRQRKAEIRRRIQEAFLTNPTFPVPLPPFAPNGAGDFALYLLSESGSIEGGSWFFFRAPTPREKSKWVGVLRNLTGERIEAASKEKDNDAGALNSNGVIFTHSDDASKEEDLTGRKQLKVLKPRETSSKQSLTELIESTTAKMKVKSSPSATLKGVGANKKASSDSSSSFPPLPSDVNLHDERVVHVCKRDFYSMLGVPPTAATDEITERYGAMHRELLARLQPTSPLHKLVPLPKDTAPDLPITIEPAMTPCRHAQLPSQLPPQSSISSSTPPNPTVASDSLRPPTPASRARRSHTPTIREEETASSSNEPAHPHSHHHHHHDPHTFTFNIPTSNSNTHPTLASSNGVTLTHMSQTTPLPSISSSLAPSSAVPPSSGKIPLSSTAAQARLQRKLRDLREIWRILRDPVRRVQYDERRYILRLDELTNDYEPPAATHAFAPVPMNTESSPLTSTAPVAPPASASSSSSSPEQSIDLDAILAHAQAQAEIFPPMAPRDTSVPPKPRLSLKSILHPLHPRPDGDDDVQTATVPPSSSDRAPDEDEAKYPALSDPASSAESDAFTMQVDPAALSSPLIASNEVVSALPVSSTVPLNDVPAAATAIAVATALNATTVTDNTSENATSAALSEQHQAHASASSSAPSSVVPVDVASTSSHPPPTSPTLPAPFVILQPDSFTRWTIGESVTILWNHWLKPTRPASSPPFTGKDAAILNSSANLAAGAGQSNPAHCVRIELMRRRTLLRDVVAAVLANDADNSGTFHCQLPMDLQTRNDYYVRLTLQWSDHGIVHSCVPPQVSTSELFTITTFEKAQVYTTGLENTLRPANGEKELTSQTHSPPLTPLPTTTLANDTQSEAGADLVHTES